MKNQQEFWKDSRTFLYCFAKDEKDFRFSGILDHILEPIYFKES